MGAPYAGYRPWGADNPDIRFDLRGRMGSVLCSACAPDEGPDDCPRKEAGHYRGSEGPADQGAGRTTWDTMTALWRKSCFAVSHRITDAEHRAEKLARSFGVKDEE